MKKQASLLPMLADLVGWGAAIHMFPNIVNKHLIRNREAGRTALATSFASGIDAGMANQVINPKVDHVLKYGLGPETLVDFEAGHALGQQIANRTQDPVKQKQLLNRLLRMHNYGFQKMTPEQQAATLEAPIVGSLARLARGDVSGKYDYARTGSKILHDEKPVTLPDTTPQTWQEKTLATIGLDPSTRQIIKDRVMNNAIGASGGLLAAKLIDPHLVLQPISSWVRKRVSESNWGNDFMKEQFIEGLEGKPMSRAKELMYDYVISPSALDTRKLGDYVRKVHGETTADATAEHLRTMTTDELINSPIEALRAAYRKTQYGALADDRVYKPMQSGLSSLGIFMPQTATKLKKDIFGSSADHMFDYLKADELTKQKMSDQYVESFGFSPQTTEAFQNLIKKPANPKIKDYALQALDKHPELEQKMVDPVIEAGVRKL